MLLPGPSKNGLSFRRSARKAIRAADFRRDRGQVRVHAGAVAEVADGPVEFAVMADADPAAVVIIARGRQARNDDRAAGRALCLHSPDRCSE